MKRDIIIIITILSLGFAAGWVVGYTSSPEENIQDVILIDEPECKIDDWDLFIEALSIVESNGDSMAVGTRDDCGILQITPILVQDANRISGEGFTLDDRFNVAKSVEMFNVIQSYYNPGHDKQLALKVWNPRAPLSYHRKVMYEYESLMLERYPK